MRRACLSLQLCISFSLLFWYGLYPFSGEIHRKQTILSKAEFVQANRDLFAELPKEEQQLVLTIKRHAAQGLEKSFLHRGEEALHLLLYGLPPFLRMYLFVSLLICLLAIKGWKAADGAFFLLPMLVLLHGVDTAMHPSWQPTSILPSEAHLQNYLLGDDWGQWREAWDRYLLAEWSHSGSLEEGRWQFELAYLKELSVLRHGKEGILFYFLFFTSTLFAVFISKRSWYKNLFFKQRLRCKTG